MRIDEILASGDEPVFSFEFFPPKTQAGERNLYAALSELRSLDPSFVSVTYGAGGSTREKTIEIVHRIRSELGLEAMAHFTCVGATVPELRSTLDEMLAAGIDNVLALRADPTPGQSPAADLALLVEKVRAGADFLITQLFFDNSVYFDFIARARAAGIEVPIIPGIMPITHAGQAQRMAALRGASVQ